MFKNLRKKLDSFEKDLEAALEEELEKQLEAELAKAVDDVEEEAPEPEPAAPPPPAPEPVAPGRVKATEPKPEPKPEVKPEVEPEVKPEAKPEPRPTPAPPPVKAPEPAPEPRHEVKPEPRPTATPEPTAPQQVKAPEPAPAPPTPPAAPPTIVGATPMPAPRERVRKPGGPVKKTDKELAAEIEASLAAELAGAVESQKDIERSIRETAGEGAAVVRLSDEKLDDLLWELEIALMESDVALPVVEAIKRNVREQLREARIPKRGAHDVVQQVLKTAVRRVLNEPFDFDKFIETSAKPVVVMFIGVNGTGKTTSIAKVAARLKSKGKTVVMAAGDTFRAGAVAQLEQHANRLGVKMIKHEGKNADPAAVAFDAIDHAKSRHKEVVLLDTAGRQQTNKNLMDEMEKIKRVAQPDLILFVGDSLAGNDAVSQADKFNEVVGIDGVILTKVDADAKGGAALSVAYAIGKPLVFIGLGQEYEDLVPFDRDWLVERMFGGESEEAEVTA